MEHKTPKNIKTHKNREPSPKKQQTGTYKKNETVKIIIKKRKSKDKTLKNKDLEKYTENNIQMSIIEPNTTRLNEFYIELMEDLAFIMRQKKDFIRSKAYNNAKDTITSFKDNIIDPQQLKGKPGIGNTIFEKLVEYKNTGTLSILQREENLIKKRKAISVFIDIYGVGEKKAEDLVEKGFVSLEDLEKKKTEVLNDKQQIGLKYYNDILKRIPRSEIDEYHKIFIDHFDEQHGTMEIVGSYRRGAENSGDIDAIITSDTSETFKKFIDILVEKNVIVEILSRGPSKCLVITKLPSSQYARRVDFLYTSKEEYPFATLYFTGSKEFNTAMRERALKMGYTLNEHGFSKMEGRKKGDKLSRVFKDEKEIFDFLKMEYKTPFERNDPIIRELGSSQKVPEITPKETIQITKKNKTCKKQDESKKNIDFFKKNGIKVLEGLKEKELSNMLDTANNAFHCIGQSIMTDNEYDIMHEFIEKKYPKNKSLQEVGSAFVKNKVRLPYEMWSMDKIKPDTGILETWSTKYNGPYVLSCKLDGVSGLYTTENNEKKLYTRGDGKVGQDVSHLIPYLQLPDIKDVVLRGEFIIPKQKFDEKYKEKFANPRNLVAGIVNQKTKDEKMNDIDFIAYELIKYPNQKNGIRPSDQMQLLQQMNVLTVQNRLVNELSNTMLSDILQDLRRSYDYEIDGIIVSDDKIYPRISGNPKHAFAFKMVLSDQIAEAHVVDVLWSPSKDGYLKPRVQIVPVRLGGVTITYVTGFNGSFIEINKIGIGAIIMLVRSGDVIPYIKSITVPAEKAKMPELEYIWNETHVDIMLKDKTSNITVLEKNISGFFKSLDVDGLGAGNVAKIVKGGFNSICKIIHMTLDDFMTIEGFKQKMAEKVYNSIQSKINSAPITKIAAASNVFGRGFSDKKIELIMNDYSDVLVVDRPDIIKIQNIKGIEKKTAEAFVSHIQEFKAFMKDCQLEYKLDQSVETIKIDGSHELFEKSVVITGFRDKSLEEILKNVGAKLGSSVNKKTYIVLIKNEGETSSKIEEAKKHNIPIMVFDEFMKKYF